MADGGPGRTPAEAFAARLKTGGGVSGTLTLFPYAGNVVAVNAQNVIVPPTGLTRLVGDNLIDATGADSGAPGGANTLYYVYISNGKASFSPSSIRLSATAPSLVNGTKYLGVAGNALNWRFAGWVRLDGTPNFASDNVNALIVNYYNRDSQYIQASPNYADTNAYQFTAIPNGNWAAIGGATLDTITLIANGEDDLLAHIFALLQSDVVAFVGIGVDGAAEPIVSAEALTGGSAVATPSCSKPLKLGEGFHTLQFIAANDGGTCSFYHDTPRKGATKGPIVTGFNLLVPV